MSVSTAMNLAIASVERKPQVTRSIYRNLPLDQLKGLPEVLRRLDDAVSRRASEAVYNQLNDELRLTMQIEPPEDSSPEIQQAFLEGVRAVEEQLEKRVVAIGTRLGLIKDDDDDDAGLQEIG